MLGHRHPEHRARVLVSTPLVRVVEVCCRAPAGLSATDESRDVPWFVVPRRGVFGFYARGRSHLVWPSRLLWIPPDEPYRFTHPADGGDDCLMLSLAPRLWPEVADRAGLCLVEATAGMVAELPAQALFRGAALLRLAQVDDAGRLEEFALSFAGELAAALSGGNEPEPPRRPAEHVRLAEQAAAFVAARYREPISRLLDAAAAAVRCSPFHLARVFRREAGCTIHAFRERLRLADALHAVTAGASDLAELADRLGYASHSHLTDNFRHAYGLPPSAVRDAFRGIRGTAQDSGSAGRELAVPLPI